MYFYTRKGGISFHGFCTFSSNLLLQGSRSTLPSRNHVYMVRTVVFDLFLLKKCAAKSLPPKNEEQIQAFDGEKKMSYIYFAWWIWIQRLVMLVCWKGMSEWTWTKRTLAACTFVCMPFFVQLGKVTMQSNIHCKTVSPSPPKKIIIVYTSYVPVQK